MTQLLNHLRRHRKLMALSQADLAYLLGAGSGAKVCRYERFLREPGLRTLLAYEAIFQVSVRELLPGLCQKIERNVAARAAELLQQKDGRVPAGQTERRRKALARLAALHTNSRP